MATGTTRSLRGWSMPFSVRVVAQSSGDLENAEFRWFQFYSISHTSKWGAFITARSFASECSDPKSRLENTSSVLLFLISSDAVRDLSSFIWHPQNSNVLLCMKSETTLEVDHSKRNSMPERRVCLYPHRPCIRTTDTSRTTNILLCGHGIKSKSQRPGTTPLE